MRIRLAEKLLCVIFILGAAIPKSAYAGPYTDDLSRCLVSSTTKSDKVTIESWVFSTMALSPDIASLASISNKQREEFTIKTAKIFEKLLTEACLKEARAAVKNEGVGALDVGFSILGQAALAEISANHAVSAAMISFGSKIDKAKISSALSIGQ